MISDDDSFLSAYMDGQLDPDHHQRVESALVSQPQLAEQFRRLTVLRDLVAGLARDQSVDVTPQVMERIQGRRPPPRRFPAFHSWPPGRVRRFAAAGVLTTAAGVILAISLAISHSPRFSRPHQATSRALGTGIAVAKSTTARSDTGATTDARETRPSSSHTSPLSAVAADTPGESGSLAHIGSVVESTGSVPSRDLEHVLQFLDNPNLRRFFLVKSGQNGKGEQQVASVIERTTRYGFFKITVSQGIVIDPRHPDEATVFALIVNPKELDLLRDQLRVALPDLIEEPPVDPGIVTQLAGIGQVQAFHPAAPADVSIPRADVALRTRVADAAENAGPPDSSKKQASRDPTIEQERSAPLPAPARPGSGSEPVPGAAHTPASPVDGAQVAARPQKGDPLELVPGTKDGHDPAGPSSIARLTEGPDDRIVVLVWVCKPSR